MAGIFFIKDGKGNLFCPFGKGQYPLMSYRLSADTHARLIRKYSLTIFDIFAYHKVFRILFGFQGVNILS